MVIQDHTERDQISITGSQKEKAGAQTTKGRNA